MRPETQKKIEELEAAKKEAYEKKDWVEDVRLGNELLRLVSEENERLDWRNANAENIKAFVSELKDCGSAEDVSTFIQRLSAAFKVVQASSTTNERKRAQNGSKKVNDADILSAIGAGTMGVGELADKLGADKNALAATLKRMTADGKVKKSGDRRTTKYSRA